MRRLIPLLLLTPLLAAQSAPEVEITAEPHHQLVLANDQVRVFHVDVPPHTDTLLHRHRHDYIYVMLGDTEIVNAVEGKDPVTVKLKDGETGFHAGGFVHTVRNHDQPFRNLTIEILQDEKLRQSSAHPDTAHVDPAHPDKNPDKNKDKEDDRGLEILHGGTKEILFVKDGIRVSEIELQPGGTAPKPAAAYLLVAVSDLRLDAADKPRNAPHNAWDQMDIKSGDSSWIPPVALHALTNTTQRTVKFVTLEFP